MSIDLENCGGGLGQNHLLKNVGRLMSLQIQMVTYVHGLVGKIFGEVMEFYDE